jgi:Thioesterase-like superfamily
VADSFFAPLGRDRFLATDHTTGPWEPGAQHGGPPGALLGRAIELCAPRPEMVVARVSCDILGPVPVGELTVAAAVVRPGRSVELVEASLHASGREVMRARAWRVLRTGAVAPPQPGPPPAVLATEPSPTPHGWVGGYLSAMEWRLVSGSFAEPGPAVVWTRMRHPLVPDEPPSPLQRVLIAADSGNGVSSELPLIDWMFINPELTVHLHRAAVGEWVCVDATTTISASGAGLATSILSDQDGAIGMGAQSLLVVPRAVRG